MREALTGLGFRYRLHRKDLPGKPDIVMKSRGIVIFVHGCFWHLHDCKAGRKIPKTNPDYWSQKRQRNAAHDAANRGLLEAAGWRVITIWECETKDQDQLRDLISRRLA